MNSYALIDGGNNGGSNNLYVAYTSAQSNQFFFNLKGITHIFQYRC